MIVMKYEISDIELKLLEKSIAKFIELWSAAGYESFPKLHYIVHIPRAIEK